MAKRPPEPRLRSVFGANAKAARLAAGLSQTQVAAQIGTSQSYYGQIERGTVNVTLETMEAIARAFGLDPASMLQTRPRRK
jgi:transcriptional regulator with XRE-family HTH domain